MWVKGYFRSRDNINAVVSPKSPAHHWQWLMRAAAPALSASLGDTLVPCILVGWVSSHSCYLQLLEPRRSTLGNLVHLSLPRHLTFVYLLNLIPTPGGREGADSKKNCCRKRYSYLEFYHQHPIRCWWIEVCSCLAKEKQCSNMGAGLVSQRWQVSLRSRGRCLECKITWHLVVSCTAAKLSPLSSLHNFPNTAMKININSVLHVAHRSREKKMLPSEKKRKTDDFLYQVQKDSLEGWTSWGEAAKSVSTTRLACCLCVSALQWCILFACTFFSLFYWRGRGGAHKLQMGI